MSQEQLLASYVVRINENHGRPVIAVLDMQRGCTAFFDCFQELAYYLEQSVVEKLQAPYRRQFSGN